MGCRKGREERKEKCVGKEIERREGRSGRTKRKKEGEEEGRKHVQMESWEWQRREKKIGGRKDNERKR